MITEPCERKLCRVPENPLNRDTVLVLMPFTQVVKTLVSNKLINVVFRGRGIDSKMALRLALIVIRVTKIATKLA